MFTIYTFLLYIVAAPANLENIETTVAAINCLLISPLHKL